MDPVSALAGLVIASGSLARAIYRVYKRLGDAQDEIFIFWNEVNSFQAILERYKILVEKDQDQDDTPDDFSVEPVCEKLLKDMKDVLYDVKKVQRSSLYSLSEMVMRERIRWVMKASKVKSIYMYLHGLKSSMSCVMHFVTINELRRRIQELERRLQEDNREFLVEIQQLQSRMKEEQAQLRDEVKQLKHHIQAIRKEERHHSVFSARHHNDFQIVFESSNLTERVLEASEEYAPPNRRNKASSRSSSNSHKRSGRSLASTSRAAAAQSPIPPVQQSPPVHPNEFVAPTPPFSISSSLANGRESPIIIPPAPEPSPSPGPDNQIVRVASHASSSTPSVVSEYQGENRTSRLYGPLKPQRPRPPGAEPTALFRGSENGHGEDEDEDGEI